MSDANELYAKAFPEDVERRALRAENATLRARVAELEADNIRLTGLAGPSSYTKTVATLRERLAAVERELEQQKHAASLMASAMDERDAAIQERDEARAATFMGPGPLAVTWREHAEALEQGIAEIELERQKTASERDALALGARTVRALIDRMLAGDDCPMCDYGKSRNPAKPCWPECAFGQARALAATDPKGET